MTGVRVCSVFPVLIAALMLAGCVGSAPIRRTQQYTLLTTLSMAGSNDAGTLVNGPVLQLAEIRAPAWLNSTRMYYRLDYRADAELAAYSLSEWVAPPPTLLANMLQAALADMARWKAVVGPAAAGDADKTLRITLNGFQQVFASKTHSVGVIDATATLLAGHVIAQRRFHITAPAPAPDARGGVQALSHASRALAGRIREWLTSVLERTGRAQQS